MKMGCVIVVLGWVFAAPVSAQDAYVVFQYNSDLEQNDGSGGTLHEVVRGETLYSIVQRTNVSLPASRAARPVTRTISATDVCGTSNSTNMHSKMQNL